MNQTGTNYFDWQEVPVSKAIPFGNLRVGSKVIVQGQAKEDADR